MALLICASILALTPVLEQKTFITEGIRHENILCSPAVLRILPPADERQPSHAEIKSKHVVCLLEIAFLYRASTTMLKLQVAIHNVCNGSKQVSSRFAPVEDQKYKNKTWANKFPTEMFISKVEHKPCNTTPASKIGSLSQSDSRWLWGTIQSLSQLCKDYEVVYIMTWAACSDFILVSMNGTVHNLGTNNW